MPVQLRASFWFLVCLFMQRGITAITTPVFTRLLTPEEFGQVNVFTSWMNVVAIFVTLRISYGVYTQGLVKFEEDRARYASSMQGLLLSLCAAWSVAYLLSQSFWNALFHLTTAQMLAMLIMIWTEETFVLWAEERRNQYQYKTLVAVTVAVSALKPLVAIVSILVAEDKVTARIFSFALVELAGYFGLFVIQLYRGRQFFSAKYWKYALTFNLPLIPHYLSQTVLTSSDRIMIENMVGEAEAGLYSLACLLSMVMTLFNQAFSQAMSPWLYRKIKTRQTQDISSVAIPALSLIGGANLILIALAPEIVAVFAPKEYYDAIWVVPPVAMSVFFMFAYNLFSCFEFYYEKTAFIMAASVVSALSNVVMNYFFIGIFGYYAAGYTTLACYMINALGHYLFMRRICALYHHGQAYDPKILFSITAAFLCIGFLFLFSYRYPALRYALLCGVLAFAFSQRRFIITKLKLILSARKRND